MCGIAAIKLKKGSEPTLNILEELSGIAHFLSHRGEDGVGVVWSNGKRLRAFKRGGVVSEVFPQLFTTVPAEKLLATQAMVHIRYKTEGLADLSSLQPYVLDNGQAPVYALADNGNLVDYLTHKKKMESEGFDFETTNEAELMLRFIITHHNQEKISRSQSEVDFTRSIFAAMTKFHGAFTTILMTRNNLFGFVDPLAFRPMQYAETKKFQLLVSETCALGRFSDQITLKQEIDRGELYHLNPNPNAALRIFSLPAADLNQKSSAPKHCIFETIYFARPDSYQWGINIHEYRRNVGRTLAQLDMTDGSPVVPDLIMPVPDSANFYALGYAKERQMMDKYLPHGLIRSHDAMRTFILDGQEKRLASVKDKFNPLRFDLEGKSIILLDDSIVRGNTIVKIIRMVFGAGGREIHVRIGSPPIINVCHYGIDMKDFDEIAWNKYGDYEGIINYIREKIKDYLEQGRRFSLKYLPLEMLPKTVAQPNHFCMACFNSVYPTPTPT